MLMIYFFQLGTLEKKKWSEDFLNVEECVGVFFFLILYFKQVDLKIEVLVKTPLTFSS